ncbi:MAG: serine/threonine protein phosphatase [Sphingomonadales bacterium]|nr:serine/threonine protein phosphatase [Sphingomonadales bacterium]
MLRSLLAKSRKSPPRPHVPDDVRVYAIGDIHGRADLLDDLLARIDADDAARTPKRRLMIFLGDLIDRGPDSAGVVDRILRMAGPDVRVLAGNHEELMLSALDGDREATRVFARAGGRETILSYGVDTQTYDRADFAELTELMRTHVPPAHVAFLQGLENLIEIGDYAFVHAGIRPGVPLAEQRTEHLRWIRSGFLDHKQPHPRMIVHGHTITDTVDERSNRIGIDTGAYASGKLTAIGLDGAERWFIATA